MSSNLSAGRRAAIVAGLRTPFLKAVPTSPSSTSSSAAMPTWCWPVAWRCSPTCQSRSVQRWLARWSQLRPAFDRRYGTVTAGNSSPLTDGAASVLLMSEERAAVYPAGLAERHGLRYAPAESLLAARRCFEDQSAQTQKHHPSSGEP